MQGCQYEISQAVKTDWKTLDERHYISTDYTKRFVVYLPPT